jgi:hypothetical protein
MRRTVMLGDDARHARMTSIAVFELPGRQLGDTEVFRQQVAQHYAHPRAPDFRKGEQVHVRRASTLDPAHPAHRRQ